MRSVIIFAGTAEGRTLSEYLSGRGVRVTACVATEYGETLLPEHEYIKVHTGRMDREQMADFIRQEGAGLVVDATHPYAAVVSQNVSKACEDTQCFEAPYLLPDWRKPLKASENFLASTHIIPEIPYPETDIR